MIGPSWTCLWSCATDWKQRHICRQQPWVHSDFAHCRRLRHSDGQSLKNLARAGRVHLIYFDLLLASLLWNAPMLRKACPYRRLGFCQRKFSSKNARRTVRKSTQTRQNKCEKLNQIKRNREFNQMQLRIILRLNRGDSLDKRDIQWITFIKVYTTNKERKNYLHPSQISWLAIAVHFRSIEPPSVRLALR